LASGGLKASINMKICDVLQKETILADLKAQNKKGILEELVAPVSEIANVNQEDLVKVLMERERLGSTGIGGGIGIPHGKMNEIDSLVLGFGLSRKGVDFESLDGQFVFTLNLVDKGETVGCEITVPIALRFSDPFLIAGLHLVGIVGKRCNPH